MNKEVYGLITFKSTHFALAAERLLDKMEINYKSIPTPREVSLSCGLAIFFPLEDMDQIKELIEGEELKAEKLYI